MANEAMLPTLEDADFRLDSRSWEILPYADADWRPVRANPYGDVFEITLQFGTPVQLFTHAAAMRETAAAGKRMPTPEQMRSVLSADPSVLAGMSAGGRVAWESFEEIWRFGFYWAFRESASEAPGFLVDFLQGKAWTVTDYDRSMCFAVRCLKG